LTRVQDFYTIELTIRHPVYSPEHISRTVGVPPNWTRVIAEPSGQLKRQWNVFKATLQEGKSNSEYELALDKVGLFLNANENNWTDFIAGGAEMELTISLTVSPTEEVCDKCLELSLTPIFLQNLASRGIGLRIQGWGGGKPGTGTCEK
jgi:hypothetical protein